MCLDTLTRKIEPPDQEERTVFKVFSLMYDRLYPCAMLSRAPYIAGEWITAMRHVIPISDSDERYLSGFHAFLHAQEAIDWSVAQEIVLEIKVRSVHTEGTQGKLPSVVADEMFIPVDWETKIMRRVVKQ